MGNHLYDALFGIHAGKDSGFLLMPDGGRIDHAVFPVRVAQPAGALATLVIPENPVAGIIGRIRNARCRHRFAMFPGQVS